MRLHRSSRAGSPAVGRAVPALAATAFAVAALTACSTTSLLPAMHSAEGQEAVPCRVGVAQPESDTYYSQELHAGVEEAAIEFGCELVVSADLDPDAASGDDDERSAVEQQLGEVEALMGSGVDAVIVVPIDPEGFDEAVALAAEDAERAEDDRDRWGADPDGRADGREAEDPAPPLISVGAGLESADTVVSADEELAASDLAVWLSGQEPVEDLRFAVLGDADAADRDLREQGFRVPLEALGADHARTASSASTPRETEALAFGLSRSAPGVDFIYTTDEISTAAAAAVLNRDGGDVFVVGWGLSRAAFEAFDAGTLRAAVQEDARQQGFEAVQEAWYIAGGEDPRELVEVPALLVTDENLEDFRPLFD